MSVLRVNRHVLVFTPFNVVCGEIEQIKISLTLTLYMSVVRANTPGR